ncbi:hypothetical protein OH492_14335 [Vibrio chagasii]|nr:hypothetical protein [Vibrio chagasii]
MAVLQDLCDNVIRFTSIWKRQPVISQAISRADFIEGGILVSRRRKASSAQTSAPPCPLSSYSAIQLSEVRIP